MADRVSVPKVVAYSLLGAPEDSAVVTKLVAYVVLEPGDEGPDTSNRQGHVHTQILRRD